MFSKGRPQISAENLHNRITAAEIVCRYFGEQVPCLIHSPLRHDEHRSLSLFYSADGGTVLFKDHANGLAGDIIQLLSRMWNLSRTETIYRIWNECDCGSRQQVVVKKEPPQPKDIQIKIRKAEQYDFDYWNSYGIGPKWLRAARILPISHFVLVKGGQSAIYKADKYAYAYWSKNGVKIYQPYSVPKWMSVQKKDYVQLYNMLPRAGNAVCVCSSMKDALCLWANLGIPAVAPQSEGTSIPFVVSEDLKHRFKHCFIMYDNDKAGLEYAKTAATETGFTNIVLPYFNGGKDISDYFKSLLDKRDFLKLKQLFNGETHKTNDGQ